MKWKLVIHNKVMYNVEHWKGETIKKPKIRILLVLDMNKLNYKTFFEVKFWVA